MSKYSLLNASGLPDPTAKQAMDNILNEQDRVKQFIKMLKMAADLSDFEILNRLEIRDKRTGGIYK